MEQIIVRHPGGTTALLTSRARKSGVTKAEQSITLLGADTVAITVKSATPLTFHLGDQIDVYGKTYTLNQLPGIKKTGNRNFEYTLTFEGVQYELIDAQFLLPDDTVLDSFTGDLEDFLGILIGNLTRVYPGKWVLGVFPADTEFKTLTYTEKNCLEVLQDLCEQYSTEFEITQANGVRTLNIKTAGVNFPYTFRYGRTGGLYELTRQNINSKNVVTRLYVYGGSSNLGDKYRYTRLCLPGKAKNASYIEDAAAIAAYGLKENTKIFDDIKPERYGEVTAAGSAYYAFKDATMNFDLNEKDSAGNTKWLIDGVNAKVKFTTGNLAGYEFDVHKYDHATKEIQVVPFTDENGMKFPSETSAAFQFSVGDKYFFTDINLPDAYKTDAENELLAEGNKVITEYSQPQVQYGLSIDENFIRQFAGELTVVNLFAVGDYIPVEDEDIGVNKSVRITAFTRDLLREYKYNITLGDSVTKTTITRVIEDLQKIDNVIEINDLADPSKARRNWKASQEVLANVFDPEGHYYSEKIKPLSIETTMLATGARSQQFVLQNTRFEPNYEGNPNTVKVVGGTLVHYTIAETVKSWQLNTATFSNLVSGTVYYIYARCQKTGTAGNIVFDTVQRKVDSDPTYYYFLVGSLSSAITDTDGKRPARLIALTYGATTINGRFITTGRIESTDGKTYFDLDNGEIGGLIKLFNNGQYDDISYLTESLNNYTEINGGLVLSKLIAVRDNSGNIVSFVNSYNDLGGLLRKTAFAAGVNDFGTDKADAMVNIKHDGFGSRIGVFRIDNDGIAVTNNLGSRCIIITNKTLENESNDIKNFESSGRNIGLTTYISATADIAKVGDNFYTASDNVNETQIYKYSISEEILPGTYDFLLSANHLKVTLSCNVNFAQLYATQENYSNIHLQVSIIATLLLNGEVLAAETVNEYIDDTYSYTGDTPESRILTKTVDTSTLFTKPVELIIPPRNITTVELQFEVKITGSYMCYPIDRFMFPIRAIIRDINKKEGLVYEINPNMNLLIIGSNGIKLTQLANKTETGKIHISDSGTILPISGEAAELYIDDNGYVKAQQ